MTTPGIPNDYALSTTCFGARLSTIQDQIFAAVGMGFRRLELGLTGAPPAMTGLEDAQRETGVTITSLIAGCRDVQKGSMPSERLGSLVAEECERALNSVRRHVRLARSWGCETVVLRGSKLEDVKLQKLASDLESRLATDGSSPEIKEEILAFVRKAQRQQQSQIEQFCRSLHTLRQEAPDMTFAIEPGREIDDLLGFDAIGWILEDFDQRVGYWHDVGRVHLRETIGLPPQGEWLEAYAARMIGIHLQDAAADEAEMPIGSGEVDFQLLREYVPEGAERVVEISPSHGRAEILVSVRFLTDNGF